MKATFKSDILCNVPQGGREPSTPVPFQGGLSLAWLQETISKRGFHNNMPAWSSIINISTMSLRRTLQSEDGENRGPKRGEAAEYEERYTGESQHPA